MKKACLFAGQGQQFLHMGKDLAEAYPEVCEIYSRGSEIAGFDILNLSEEQLNQTEYTQPALLTLNFALSTLVDADVDYVAGLSLGEYNALIFAGVLSFEDALRIVLRRAEIMANALKDTGMVALVKTDLESVEAALEGLDIAVCNHNTPSQIVVGGYLEDLERDIRILKDRGIKRAIPLNVSSVSHMHLMSDASVLLSNELSKYSFKKPKISFINNVDAQVQTEDFIASLSKQISHRTRLSETIELMLEKGVESFVEIGPKGSIAKAVLAHRSDVKTQTVYDLESLREVLHDTI